MTLPQFMVLFFFMAFGSSCVTKSFDQGKFTVIALQDIAAFDSKPALVTKRICDDSHGRGPLLAKFYDAIHKHQPAREAITDFSFKADILVTSKACYEVKGALVRR